MVSHLILHLICNSFAIEVFFLLYLFLSDPAYPLSILLSNVHALTAISSIALELHPSNGHLFIYFFLLFSLS